MPNPLAFDTLAYAKKLKAAGFTDLQAEVQTEALVEIVEGRLATRQNLKETEASLRRDMKASEASLKLDIERVRNDIGEITTTLRRDMIEMEQRLTIRLGCICVVSIIIGAALSKLL